ncbi:MAG: glycoside hydrolase family 15 protein [Chloroflexota bacterium]
MSNTSDYSPIGDYAIIGDCHTAALVSTAGSIDWYCPTRFDWPAMFCRLLDAGKGGYFSVRPAGGSVSSRRYVGDSNILETTFACDGARMRLTDLMPVRRRTTSHRGPDVDSSHRILRLIEVEGADVDVEVRFKPTFNYAQATTRLETAPGVGAVARAEGERATLASQGLVMDRSEDGGMRGILHVRPGERRWLVLTHEQGMENPDGALRIDCEQGLADSATYWREWSGRCIYEGPYQERVLRSALALKLLTYEPTGALVAAATTSLPEAVGGVRNWDYRFTWLRDASLMLYALATIGYEDEATDFIRWLRNTTASDGTRTPQIMYTLDGRRELPERTLENLEGYLCSRPVRVGNAAAGQRQLDIYGDVLSAAYHFHKAEDGDPVRSLAAEPLTTRSWALLRNLVEDAAASWREPDSGLWEVRGGPKHFVYSKLMCWVALDRGVRLVEELGMPGPSDRWSRARDEIRQAILTKGYNPDLGAFTQAFGDEHLDASVLGIPRLGLLPATDPRVRSTVDKIDTELTRGGLVDRYRAEDGLPGKEASFTLCSFWMVDALALGGQIDRAHDLFERVVSCSSDLGLLSEEVEPESRRLLGNYPQGFSHMSLIGSVVNLAKAERHGPEHQPQTEPERASSARQAVEGG